MFVVIPKRKKKLEVTDNKDLEIFDGLTNSYDFVKTIKNTDGYTVLMTEFIRGGRWSNYYRHVFITPSGKFYSMLIEDPATELQDWQDQLYIEIEEVFRFSESVTRYSPVDDSKVWTFEVE